MTASILTPLSLPSHRTIKILIIDDEPNVLSVLDSLLSPSHECKTAGSAIEALEYLKEESYDLVLSDIMMPGMTGLELLPKIKALRPKVPVIMITAYGDSDTKRRALEGGAQALLTKPIDFAALRAEIDKRIEEHGPL